mmetsp:Transcript_77208/g.136770  ORF Transcript_77208/g.136770 Transcript_77208/m.136770 type:complete len:99 (+) Transcript_77208:547-843(+)
MRLLNSIVAWIGNSSVGPMKRCRFASCQRNISSMNAGFSLIQVKKAPGRPGSFIVEERALGFALGRHIVGQYEDEDIGPRAEADSNLETVNRDCGQCI